MNPLRLEEAENLAASALMAMEIGENLESEIERFRAVIAKLGENQEIH